MEDQNQNLTPAAGSEPAERAEGTQIAEPAQVAEQPPKKSMFKRLLVLVVVIAAVGLSYVGYTNPQLFRAAITEVDLSDEQKDCNCLLIPSYESNAVDEGKIDVKLQTDTAAPPSDEEVHSLKFKLKWSPVDALSLNANSINFENTLFTGAELKSVNTDTPGEAIVSFFSNTPVSLTGVNDGASVVKLILNVDGTPGSTVTTSVEDVEVIIATGDPTNPFVFSQQYTQIDSGTFALTEQADLKVLYAETLNSNTVAVHYSDFLSSPGTYAFSDGLNIDGVPEIAFDTALSNQFSEPQKVVIVPTENQISGTLYTVTASNASGNVEGSLDPDLDQAQFAGFNIDTINNPESPVQLLSIDVNSQTEILLNFSGDLEPDTVSPVNVVVESFDNADSEFVELTVSSTEIVDASVVRVTTNQQESGENYFVRFNGVTDQSDLPLSNARILNFLGFTVEAVNVQNLSAASFANDASQTLVVVGTGLDSIVQARLGTTNLIIAEQSEGAVSLILPAGIEPGVYDLTFVSATGDTVEVASAVTISTAERPFRINSDQSVAIPERVAPDGETEVTFSVLVEDPLDFASVDTVVINLQPIGGEPGVEMAPGNIVELGQFYTVTSTVNTSTPTSVDPIELAVEARKGEEVVEGTVSVTITNDVVTSIAPTFDQAYINPSTVAPDGVTPVVVTAKLTDLDGAATISSVVADLGELGAGFVPLTPLNAESTDLLTAFFISAEFTLPSTTAEGDYTVLVTATDQTGEEVETELTITVSNELTQPTIDASRSYIAPRNSVPRDGVSGLTVHAMVTDPNTLADIDSVIAYAPTLGVSPVALIRDPAASESSKTALYSSSAIIPPLTTRFGEHQIEVVATDTAGGVGNTIIRMELADRNIIGDAPRVFSGKSYTTPRVAVNDGETTVTLYTFVRDDDEDLQSVVVNLGNIGQHGPETPADFAAAGGAGDAVPVGSGGCPTGSTTIVCMQPSFSEGADGQWFVLPGVTISKTTAASTEPYMVEVIATDASGKASRGEIPVTVTSTEGFADDQKPPKLVAAVATGEGTVEVVFNEELSAFSIASSGRDFTITNRDDITDELEVVGATINATGTIVTLDTENQEPSKQYVLTASSDITDAVGINLTAGAASRAFFAGFDDSTKDPVIDFVAATNSDTVEIEFQENLRPTSVKTGNTGSDFDVQIFQADTSNAPLAVKGVNFLGAGNVLEVKTAEMKSGQRYRLQLKDVASAGGYELGRTATKFFKSIRIREIRSESVGSGADLNGDGNVDFIDFTIFSSFYGASLNAAEEAATEESEGATPTPLQEGPDSLVPHTSIPAGGEIILPETE